MFHPVHYSHYWGRRIFGYWGYWGPFWGGWYDWDYYYDGWPYYCGLRGFVTEEKTVVSIPAAPPAPVETALKSMRVKLLFEGSAVRTVLEQTYANQTTNPLEVTYSVGVGKRMAVSGFEATVGSERIVGKIKGAEEAQQVYEDKISEGHTPMLGERTAEGSFNMSLGNLQPGQEITIRVELLSEIEQSEDGSDSIFFGLPEAMFPAKHVVYDLTLDVTIAYPGGCKKVTIVCNEEEKVDVVSTPDDYKYSRRFEAGKPCIKGIFAVEFEPAKAAEPCCVFEESPLDAGKYAALLSFTPDWSRVDRQALAPCVEVIFLIDRSGSMGDSKDGAKKRIVQAKEAMALFLSSLPEGSKFQIIGFGSRYSLLFNNGSQPLNESTLKQANEHVARLQADMGGTALLEPLEIALEEVASSEYPRIVFVLTDGNVENTEEVLKLVRTQARSARCFAIGLGADADEKLVKGLAKAGRGLADFVSDDATGNLSLQTVVVRQLSRALEPTLRKPSIAWQGCKPAKVSPEVLPAVLNGDRLLVYAHDVKLETADAKQIGAVVTGLAPDSSPFSQAVVSRHTIGNTISKLCAWKEILFLQEQLEQLEEQLKKARPKSRQFTEATSKIASTKASIKGLGIKFELATKYTSWIAVHENKEFTSSSMVAAAIPSLNDPKKEPEKPQEKVTTTTTTTTTYVHDYYYGDYVPSTAYSSVTVVSNEAPKASVSAAPASAGRGGGGSAKREEKEKQQQQQQQQAPAYQPAAERRDEGRVAARKQASYSSHGDDEEAESSSYSSSSVSHEARPSSSAKSKRAVAGPSRSAEASYSSPPPPPAAAAPSMSYNSAPAPQRYYSHTVTTWEDMSEERKAQLLVKTRGNPEDIVPIAKLQDASGAWKLDALLQFFPEAKELLAKNPVADETVWTTALAIAFLMKKKPDDEPTWALLVQKGRHYVRKYLVLQRLMNLDPVQEALKLI